MNWVAITSLALVAIIVSASATPVDTDVFEGRKIDSNSKPWGSSFGSSKDNEKKNKYLSSSSDFYSNQEKDTEKSETPKAVYTYKNGELEESETDALSQVQDNNMYSKQVVYRKPSKKSDSKGTDFLDLIPISDEEKNTEQKIVIYQKRTPLMRMMVGLFDIMSDIVYIIIQDNFGPQRAQEKSDDPNSKYSNRNWPLLKNVFVKYFKLIRETDMLGDIDRVLPIAQIEEAMERDDGREVWMILYKSLNSDFFTYAFNTVMDSFLAPYYFYGEQILGLEHGQLRREAAPVFTLMKPWVTMMEHVMKVIGRSVMNYGHSVARSLSSVVYQQYEIETEDGRAVESAGLSTFGVAAGLGTAAAATAYLLYNSFAGEEVTSVDDVYRQRRSADDVNVPADINVIIDSVQDPVFANFGDNKQRRNKKAKSILQSKLESLTKMHSTFGV